MKLGIGTYTFAWSIGAPGYMPDTPLDAFALLGLAERLGVKVVQYGPNLSLDQLPDADLDRLLARARAMETEIEIGARGIDAGSLAAQVELAKRVGSSILRWSTEVSDAITVGIGEVADCVEQLLPTLRRSKIRLAIENSRIPARQLAEMMRAIDSPWLGVTLDTVNSLAIPEGTEAVVESLAPYVASLHIKDFRVKRLPQRMGFVVEGRPAGEGQLDTPRLLACLRSAGVRANAILELWPPQQDSLPETIAIEHRWAAASVKYLRGYIPG